MVGSGTLSTPVALGPPVTVTGDSSFEVTPERVEDFAIQTETVTVVCASGNRHTAEWTGLAVVDLLEAAEAPASTTHIVVESDDKYRVAIPVAEAIEGLLAYTKDDVAIGENHAYANRLVSPNTEGARDIKGVSRIEPTTLDPEENPEDLENLFPDGERFTANRFKDSDEEPDQTQ